jgi:hypothetical protein
MSTMPVPGDAAPGFLAEPGQCWRMIFDDGLQGTHCTLPVEFRGQFANAGHRWTVWACQRHRDGLESLTRLR